MATDEPIATFTIPSVSAEAMRTMAVMHRDGNPIHLYPEFAAAYGLGDRVVNPGSGNVGYALNALAQLGPDVRVERVQLKFMANVFAEDEAVATVSLAGEEADGDRRRLTCDVALDVTGGGRAMESTAIVTVPGA
jgi:acyl dehydratase